ncbi:MAG: FRG domain-containing protein [Spirochaetales bacterium]
MIEHVVKNAVEYIQLINQIKTDQESYNNKADLLFRGQSAMKDPLPKAARLSAKGEILVIEKLIFSEFKRNYSSKFGVIPADDWEWLALAQHYGLPTRLLDWSYSSLIALWFAVKDDLTILNKEKPFNGHVNVYVLAATLEKWKEIEDTTSPFDIDSIKIFRPQAVSERIKVQGSVFTAHPLKNSDNIIDFWNHGGLASHFFNIMIPNEYVIPIRRELKIMGINNYTAFPDLDGLCKHLQWQYYNYQDEIEFENIKKS